MSDHEYYDEEEDSVVEVAIPDAIKIAAQFEQTQRRLQQTKLEKLHRGLLEQIKSLEISHKTQ